MVPTSRRHVLQGALALGATLAGCTDRETAPTVEARDMEEHVERDPASVLLRNPTSEPLVELSTPAESATGRRGDRQRTGDYRGLVASRERADRLSIAGIDGADEARQFVRETDFSSETLGIESSRVGECYRQELCSVIWSEVEYQTWFLETYRDATVACSEGEHHRLATLFRIPTTLDPETVENSGRGVTHHGCRAPRPEGRPGGDP